MKNKSMKCCCQRNNNVSRFSTASIIPPTINQPSLNLYILAFNKKTTSLLRAILCHSLLLHPLYLSLTLSHTHTHSHFLSLFFTHSHLSPSLSKLAQYLAMAAQQDIGNAEDAIILADIFIAENKVSVFIKAVILQYWNLYKLLQSFL